MEQALQSVRRALVGIRGEVWVVDNHSVDDSVRMVREQFPEVHLLANQQNVGFAVANNQAIRQSRGKYVLLLNPDTLVEENTFHRCLAFMESHPEAGALGVKLIDGSGAFLPESRRGFPTPWVSFCKTTGLSALFPRSRWFNEYYMGYLPENQTHAVDVLVGAFMFIRRTALDKAGLLDEAFFMYGEDIDLSYRLVQAGYVNYYFPETTIIHYKGESTKKGSLNYVRTFYQAMIIFVRKHFRGRQAAVFVGLLQAAIWLRAGITLAQNFLKMAWLPLMDALLIFGGLLLLKSGWADYYYNDPAYFKPAVVWFNFPLYTAVWVASIWLSGGYDDRYDLRRLTRGVAMGALLLAALYGLLDLTYRPSRVLLLGGALWTWLATVSWRLILHIGRFGHLRLGEHRVSNLVIVGSPTESNRVQQLLKQVGVRKNLIGTVGATPTESTLGAGWADLEEVVRIYRVNELIFCSKDLRAQDILAWMTRLGSSVQYKIVPAESLSIIGSSSKDEPGELYTIALRYNIAQPRQRRHKRFFDVGLCVVLSVTLPFWVFSQRWRGLLGEAWLPVLLGQQTWVGYTPQGELATLPKLPPSVWSPLAELPSATLLTEPLCTRLNFLYAKDWHLGRDMGIAWAGLWS